MRGRLLAGAAVGVALLLAALAAVESVSERQPAADLAEPAAMPAPDQAPHCAALPALPCCCSRAAAASSALFAAA